MLINWNEITERDFYAGLKGIKDKGGIEIIESDPSLTLSLHRNMGINRKEKGINMNKMFTTGRVKELSPDMQSKREFIAYASTQCTDRDQESIKWDAWDLNDFRKNPTLLLAHDYTSMPIGRALWIKPTPEGLAFRGKLASPGVSGVADTAWNLMAEGMLNSFSVGFQPQDYIENPHAKSTEPSRVYTKCKLLEISMVAVPSNPEAVVQSIEKAFQDYKDKASQVKPGFKRDGRYYGDRAYQQNVSKTYYDAERIRNDRFVEIDDEDVEIMLKTFRAMPQMVSEEADKYFAEFAPALAREVGKYASLYIRKAAGKAF